MAYCTAEEVLESLGFLSEIPEFIPNQSPIPELIDDSGTLADGSEIYLDHNRVIADSLILAYGPDANTLTNLILTTDYVFDNDSGKITLTSAGILKIGADNVYARQYKYIEIDGRISYKESFFTDIITATDNLIDNYCQQSFNSPTQVVREQHYGQGRYSHLYRPHQLLPFILTPTLNIAVDDVDTTFTISDTSNLASGNYLSIGKEIVSIDSVDDSTTLTVTRGVLGTSGASHSAGITLINIVVEVSDNVSGTTPTFSVQEYLVDWDIIRDTGSFVLQFIDVVSDSSIISKYPRKSIPNRVHLTYSFGRSNVPNAVSQACKVSVSQQLMSLRIGKSISEGSTEFTLGQAPIELDRGVKRMLAPYRLILGSHS